MSGAPLWSRAWLALATLTLGSCDGLPGRPAPGPEVLRPDEILNFTTLFSQNCAGCHGAEGKGGAAVPLADPVYLAFAGDDSIRGVTANGVPHTLMPAFARSAGGMLTDPQIDVLVKGIRRWARPGALNGATPPAYAAAAAGDSSRGAGVYQTFCARCHGSEGKGGAGGHSIVDGSYLALASDQDLRTTVVVGLPGLAAPDWRNDVPGRPMTDQDVSDVVAWLAAQRSQFPGQPYPSLSPETHGGSQLAIRIHHPGERSSPGWVSCSTAASPPCSACR